MGGFRVEKTAGILNRVLFKKKKKPQKKRPHPCHHNVPNHEGPPPVTTNQACMHLFQEMPASPLGPILRWGHLLTLIVF